MNPSRPNPFLRGFQDLRYERVLQISYADDCQQCYRALHPAQNALPDEVISLQPCLFDDDVAVITDGVCVPEFVRMRCPADGLVNTVLYQILGNQLGRPMHIGDLGNVEAAQNLIEQLSFATGHYSRSWEISSAHLPGDDFEHLQVRAWCNSPAGFFECFELNASHAIGCKLYSTPWATEIEGRSSICSADEVSARMLADRVPPVLLKLLLLAGQADIRLLIFDPDAAPLSELSLFTEE